MIAADILSARQTSRAARGRSALAAATIRMPAVTASGTCCTRGAATRMTRTTKAPVKTDDHRLRAPAPMLSAVAWTEPPTTAPLKTPETMFATPCPMKSLLVSPNEPSALGTVRLIPDSWTSPMITRESAGRSSAGTREKSGRRGHGRPRGMGAMSPTTATDDRSNSATATVMTTSVSAMAKSLSRVSPSRTTSSTVERPMSVVHGSASPRCRTRSSAFMILLSWRLEKPVRAPSCESRIVTEMPVMRPTITAFEMNRTRPPARRRPAASMIAPVSTASVNRPGTRCSAGRPASAPPAARHSAAVGTTGMRWELSVSAPAGVPAATA